MNRSIDIEIEGAGENTFTVRVTTPDEQQARATVTLPAAAADLPDRLRQLAEARLGDAPDRDIRPPEAAGPATVRPRQVAEGLGRALFEALLPGALLGLYYESRHQAGREDLGLRVRLSVSPDELADWPWEFLYDPREEEFICLDSSTPIVRYVARPEPVEPLRISPPLRILAMAAQPDDLADLAVTAGRKSIWLASGAGIEWATPVLYLRSPDGQLFAPESPPAEPLTPGGGPASAGVGRPAPDPGRPSPGAGRPLPGTDVAARVDELVAELRTAEGCSDWAAAVDLANRLIALRADDPEFYYARGRAYHRAVFHQTPVGSYSAAIADFTRAIELAPDDARFCYARGRSYQRAADEGDQIGDYRQAEADFTRAIELEPGNCDHFLARGFARKSLGDRAAAQSDFQRALELGCEDARAELPISRRLVGLWRSIFPG